MSFRLKTILGIALIEAVLLTALIVSVMGFLNNSNEALLQRYTLSTASTFASMIKDSLLGMDLARLQSFTNELARNPGVRYARIRNAENRVLAAAGVANFLTRTFRPDKSMETVQDGIYDVQAEVQVGGALFGHVEIGIDVSYLQEIFGQARKWSLTIAAVEMALVALFSFMLGTYLTRQLSHLKEGSRRLAQGELGYQVKESGNDELSATSRSFNIMSLQLLDNQRLQKKFDEELQKSHQQLAELNSELEHRVNDEVRKNREKDNRMLHQDKLAAIGQLAAGVAHEINNPMGFIMSNLATLKKYNDAEQKYLTALESALEENFPEERRKQLEALRQSLDMPYILKDIHPLISESLEGAERVKRIVLDLKDFAHIDEGKLRETDLNQCVRSTANIVRNEIKYAADLDLQLNEIPLVICNPQQINQVIANLLVNASQAMEKHGTITVTSRQEGEEVVLSIRDTGRGMTEEVRKRIFEPFYTTKDIGQGTGLGLSIAYDIIKKHGGEITLESEPGQGTTFTIKLPIKRT